MCPVTDLSHPPDAPVDKKYYDEKLSKTVLRDYFLNQIQQLFLRTLNMMIDATEDQVVENTQSRAPVFAVEQLQHLRIFRQCILSCMPAQGKNRISGVRRYFNQIKATGFNRQKYRQ